MSRLLRRLRFGSLSSHGEQRTSISDTEAYLHVCAEAASNSDIFSTFRRNPVYTQILEHVTAEQGAEYLAAIRRDDVVPIESYVDRFKTGDAYGDPLLHEYPGIGLISPTTLRYVKVLSDLVGLRGTLDGARIIEIGVGYGGQAKIICDRFAVSSYTLIDLAPCLALARRFLEPFRIAAVDFVPADAVTRRPSDLVISNYAFSECTRTVQDQYLDGVIRRADHGYLTCNFISQEHGVDSYSEAELLAMRPGIRALPEEPLTHAANKILVW